MSLSNKICRMSAIIAVTLAISPFNVSWADHHHDGSSGFKIKTAKWVAEKHRLIVKGTGDNDKSVTVSNAGNVSIVIGENTVNDGKWRVRVRHPASVPCRVRAEQSDGQSAERDVENAPENCDDGGATPPPSNVAPTANANGPYTGTTGSPVNFSSAGSTDSDGTIASYSWNFGDGATSSAANPGHAYASAGTYNVSLTVTDNGNASNTDTTTANIGDTTPPPPSTVPNVSINSTSRSGTPGTPVTEQAFFTSPNYNIFSTNDLGMHCGDLDTRISSILPPFNIVHAQVIRRGSNPTILTPADGVEVVYSAASNPTDPILSGINSAGTGPVASSMLADGSVYKTNFWDVATDAYRAFYPSLTLPMGLLDAFYPPTADNVDLGLPMPNVERFYLGDGYLTAVQQEANGRNAAYVLNDPLTMNSFTTDQAFFINFPFGYTSSQVNWFEAAGIPLTAFDDYGRENPWQLMRVQARVGGNVVASIDTVLPISGEANCGGCHNDPADVPAGTGTGIAATKLSGTPTLAMEDPLFDQVPLSVSREWAADINILRLHDEDNGTTLATGIDANTGRLAQPVVCQSCHYTPALDLAQLGPLGPENDKALDLNGNTLHIDSLANGRDQIKNRSMSSVMHKHHGQLDANGNEPGDPGYNANNLLFPAMPPSVNANGSLRDALLGKDILTQTCYQCHPGRRTDCLRGAMANGGMLCQDCHGDMTQVGTDFTDAVSPANPGAFKLGPHFYTDAATPRVPWANEPSCGSCHTGDASNNMHGTPGTVGDPSDGIRLMQAYLTGDPKATPIVPTNKRFAENTIAAGSAAAGNPMLYRVSKGHGDVFCEGCHGATHGIWPNKNPGANDNVAATQLQGHSGVIAECTTCHGNTMNNQITLDGPHGMHPVGANTAFADGGHEHLAENNPAQCAVCHGPGNRRSNVGTVLSEAKADRNLRGTLVRAGDPVGCTACHDGSLD